MNGKHGREHLYGTKEVATILGISKTTATELMHMFEARGQLYRVGRLMRVKAAVFSDWLEHERKVEG